MTLSEFKAWFEGFTEAIDGQPNKKQWKRICERVAQIDGEVTTYPVYVDRYWPRPWHGPYWTSQVFCGSAAKVDGINVTDTVLMNNTGEFEPHAAMFTLGKADYQDATIHG